MRQQYAFEIFVVQAWKSYSGPKFQFLGSFRPKIQGHIVQTPKSHILAWFHVFWAIACKNPSTGPTCARAWEKRSINKNNFLLYFTHLPRSPQWVDLYQIRYRGRNQLCQFFCRLVQGYWFCWESKFAYSHRNWRSPLTLSELPFRLWLPVSAILGVVSPHFKSDTGEIWPEGTDLRYPPLA